MKIKWLIQDIGKNIMLKDNFGTLQKMNALHQGFGLLEGTNSIINLENILTNLDEIYIIRGGTKALHLLENFHDIEDFCTELSPFQLEHKEIFLQKLKNSIFYTSESFDQAYYSQLDLPLLNKEAFFLPIKTNKTTTFSKSYFIKPSKDLKTFIPGILEPFQTIQNFIENSQHLKQYDHELALLAEIKLIHKEYRFFIVNKKVITYSQYKNGDHIEYDSNVPEYVVKIADEYAQLYQPHEIFTMDLAETDNGIKIVEYNCWNGSGLYHCDKVLLFSEVQRYIENAPKKGINSLKKFTYFLKKQLTSPSFFAILEELKGEIDMSDFIQLYEKNTIWAELVTYDFCNKNHRNFAPLFTYVQDKMKSLTVQNGLQAFYDWKKAHRLHQFFSNISLIVPKESTQWVTTQTEKLWDIIGGEEIQILFRKLKNQLKNQELSFFFKTIFGGYKKNSVEKEKIVEKIEESKVIFEKNIKKSKSYYFIPKSKRFILNNFSSQTIYKAHKAAQKKGWNGYFFALNYETVYKLLTFISYREIREEIYRKFNDSMQTCQFQAENQKLLNKGLILKKRLANFYGYKNYSDLVASKYMVTLHQTQKLLDESERQINEIMVKSDELMFEMFQADGFQDEMQPWDFSYYQRLLRAKYVVDTKIENHFQFEVTFPKILTQMEKIFNVSIRYIKTVQNNQIYQISDNLNRKNSAFWIVAPFARKSDKSAYEMDFVEYANLGKESIPWIQFIYLNLNKNGKMPFLTVKNTVHELGHAFHSFFSQNEKSKEACGWDLIELPSQFLENLAYRYEFLAKITSSPYLSKKQFNQEMRNYTFTDIFYFKEKIIDFKTSFELNKNINPYSNKKIINQLTRNRHSVGNYYNPFYEAEHFSNSYESDYFANYVYFFSENIAKQLNLIYKDKDFRKIFKSFDMDKKSFKEFIQSQFNVCDIDLVKMFNYDLFNK